MEALLTRASAQTFIAAGNATFTAVSKKTGKRLSYRVRAPKNIAPDQTALRFVEWLEAGQKIYLGKTQGSTFYPAPTYKGTLPVDAFQYVLEKYVHGQSDQVELWHAGKCGKCGRMLTDPASIQRGLGPTCAGSAA